MAILEGGTMFILPVGSEDLVSVTPDVLSCELGGELRLTEPVAKGVDVEITYVDEGDNGEEGQP